MIATRILTSALVTTLFIAPLTAAADAAGADHPFRFEAVDGRSLKLLEGDRPVLVYNHGQIANEKVPKARPRGAYVHPVYGLDGEVLTDDFPADHVNHRGLYWAWPHVKIGDAELDSWNVKPGLETRFIKWTQRATRPDGAALGVENGWFVGDKQVMREQVRFDVQAASGDARAIDVTLAWTVLDEPVTLRGAEGKGYGGLALRFGPRKSTVITVPNGRAKEDLVMANLPWADLSGDLGGMPNALSGAAIFIHPSDRDTPHEWMTRAYGMLAAGWPGAKPRTIAKGETVTLRYRLWIHRGNPDAAEIGRAYEAYCATAPAGESK